MQFISFPPKSPKEIISDFCNRHKITRAELGRSLKVTPQTIWRWEQEPHLLKHVYDKLDKYEQEAPIHQLTTALRELPLPYRKSAANALCRLVQAISPLTSGRHTPEDLNQLLTKAFACFLNPSETEENPLKKRKKFRKIPVDNFSQC